MTIRIFAKQDHEPEFEITDMYWFEENGVHGINDGNAHYGHYSFRVVLSPTKPDLAGFEWRDFAGSVPGPTTPLPDDE